MSEQNKVEVYRRRARGERAGLGFLDNRVVDLSDSFEILEPEEPIDLRVYARILRKRSEEHTSELQSRLHLVCRLLLEKKKQTSNITPTVPQRNITVINNRHTSVEATLTIKRARHDISGV